MKFLSDILARAGLVVDGTVTLNSVANATTDTDRFIVVDSGVVKYRTGTQLLSDIGGISGNQTITLSGDATGSGTTSIAVTLANSGVTAGTYGSSTAVPVITVDAKGRVTGVTTASISGSLTFTGDVTGSGTTGTTTTLTLANSGVTAGTYNNVTVNTKGIVTSGSNVSYLTSYTETDTLATVTGRGNTTTTRIGVTTSSPINFATSGNIGTWIGGIQDATTGWSISNNGLGLKADDNTYAGIVLATSNGLLYFGRTQGGVGTMASWLTVSNTLAAIFASSVTATSFIRSGGTSSQFLKADGSVDSTIYQSTSQKGQANGYASLDGAGKVPIAQLPSSIMEYKGTWNASTNSPSLADGTGDTGDVYRVSTAGTRNLGSGSITFDVGDYVIYNGTVWEKSDTTDAVASVNGLTGVITLTTTNIAEGTNLYYTDARARAALSFAAGSGAYNSSTGVITIPTNTNQLTNGAGFITSSALSPYLLLAGGNMTGNIAFGSSGAGLTWAANTDGASITFESTGDGASGGRALSNLLIALTDNGDEGLKVTSASAELLYVNTNQFQYKGNTVWHSANDGSGSGLDADLLDGINSGSFLRSDVVGATVTGTILSTNNANVDGPNFDVNTTNKTVNEYAYRVSRSGSAVGGILIDGRGAFASGTTVNGSTVWHQGNLTNLNQLTNGPGYITPNSTVSGWIAFQANTQGTPIIRAVQQDTTSGFYLFQGVTGSTEVFRIDRSGTGYFAGNLGIGTASPSARLDVNGENRATSFTNAGTLGTGANNARNHFTQLNAGNAIPATGWIASAFGDALADRIVIGQWTNGSQQAIFGAHNSNLTAWADTHYVSINHLFYGNGAWSSTPAMVINSSQNVGINTASPSAKLNISGISSGTSIRTDHTASYSILYSYINGASPIAFDNTSGNLDVFVGGTPRLRVGTAGQLRLHAYTSSSAFTGTAVATLAVDSSGNVITVAGSGGSQWVTSGSDIYYATGNVGIGSTASPTTRLDVRLATTDSVAGTVLSSYPIASFIANGSGGGTRGLQIGAPTGGIASPVFLKVFGTSSRFAILNQSNVENFTVLEGGNVGIGTNSPSHRLHVVGAVRTQGAEVLVNTGQGGIGWVTIEPTSATEGQIALNVVNSSGTSFASIRGNGNAYFSGSVGINNTNPGARLHVESSALQFRLSGNSNDFYVYAWGGGVNVYSTEHMYFGRDAGTDNKFYFQSRTASSTSLFVNTATERVGIFTTTPQERLDVRGNILLKGDATDGGVLSITRRYSIGPQTINFNNNHPTTNGDWTGARITSADAGNYNGYLDLAVSLGSNANEAAGTSAVASVMRLTHNRRVGVGGNTSPDTVLTVQGTGSASGHTTTDMNNIVHLTRNSHSYILFSSPDNFDQGLHFANTTDNGIVGRIAYFHRPGGDSLNFSVNQAVRMTLDASGGLTITGTLTEQSAARYKENIAPVTAALDKVDQLKPVSYNKKGSTTKEIGLIAEDVFDVFPEFVLCDDNGEPVGVHYSRLTAVLIESVKELKKEINELKNRN